MYYEKEITVNVFVLFHVIVFFFFLDGLFRIW